MANTPANKENNVPEQKKKNKNGAFRRALPFVTAVLFWCICCGVFDIVFAYQYIILAFFTAAVFAILQLRFSDISEKAKQKVKKKREEKERVFTVDFEDTDSPAGNTAVEDLEKYRILLTQIADDREKISYFRPDVEEQLRDIADKAEKIIAYCKKHPSEQPDSDRFFSYFLPTLKKFTGLYVTLCQQGMEGDNISATMREIEYAVRTMQEGFRKQLDSLFSEEALDVSTDVTVLNTLLKKEGLI